jgi:hypothetical protein
MSPAPIDPIPELRARIAALEAKFAAATPDRPAAKLAAAAERLVTAANQFGELLAAADPLQAGPGHPKRPWKPV